MPEDKNDMYKQMVEELRLQNQKRQAAQQEASDKLKQRVQQAYQGWSEVPEGLCTKTQLKREGLRIPEGAEPVAEVYAYRPGQRRHPFYDLYRREDAVARAPKATIDLYNYEELAQLWHEFLHFGPPIDQATFHPIDFCEWLNTDDDTPYGLPDVVRFLDEKEHREGTALKSQEQGETTMADYEERRDKRFYEATIDVLNDIEQRLGTIEPADDQVQSSLRYASAYGILRVYVETLLVNFTEAFSEDQLAEIRIVLDQLRTLVREDEYLDETTREKLDQLAQVLRESDEDFHSPDHDPHRDYVAEFNHEQAIKDFTELSRRMRTESCQQGKDHEGSYGADRIEESIANLMNAAAREGLAFIYHEEGDSYTLEPVPLENE
jgi:hypothetical protein